MTDDAPLSELDDSLVFASLYPGLRRFAAVVGWPNHDPDDLVQEAVARALRRGALHTLDNPGAYLRTSIVHLAANHSRGRVLRSRARNTLENHHGAATDVYPSDLDELRRLRPADRALLYLSLVEQRPFMEIASLLGISEPAARKRSSRALARLRDELTTSEAAP